MLFDSNGLDRDEDENDAFGGGSTAKLVSKDSTPVSDQIMMLMSVLLLLLHLPLCHLYDCCLMAMDRTVMMM